MRSTSRSSAASAPKRRRSSIPDGQIYAQVELKREELVVADLDIDLATQAMFKFDPEGCARMLFADTVAPHECSDALRGASSVD
jgi:hypothetical protein